MNEVANTFRALSDDVPLVTSVWCKVGIHSWTKYTAPDKRKEGVYEVLSQLRGCEHCGIIKVNVLRRY